MLSLRDVAERHPNGLAVVDQDSSLSFAKLFAKSEAIAGDYGLDGDQCTPRAFLARNDVFTMALVWALWERRIPALPINPRWTDRERAEVIGLAGARWLEEPSKKSPARDSNSPPNYRRTDRSAYDNLPRLLIATSGSSGAAKVVRLSLPALEAATQASVAHLQMTTHDRWLWSLNPSHIGGMAILLRCLATESSVVMAEPSMPAEELVRRIQRSGVTLASLVPTQLERVLDHSIDPSSIRSLRAVLLGGAHSPWTLVRRARLAGWPVLTTYGLSEASSQVCTQPLTEAHNVHPAIHVGRPLPGVEVAIRNQVICIRGSTLFDGYCGDHGSPFDADGWFQTGDLGELTAAGELVPHGRHDDCIVTGGEKVSAIEVESILLELSSVREAAVVPLADATWGQVVAAAVVLAPATPVDGKVAELDAALAHRLAPHKRPRRWLFLDDLPLTANGKLNRPAVKALFEQSQNPPA